MTVQQVLDALTRARRAGAQGGGPAKQGRRTWYLHKHGSWVLLQLQVGKWANRTELELTVNTVARPAGTADDDVHVGANAPFWARPDDIEPWLGDNDHWWRLDARTDADALGRELTRHLLDGALPRRRRLLDLETALAAGPAWPRAVRPATR